MVNPINNLDSNIPSDWECRPLATLFRFKNGINASKESYGTGIKFINVMEVINHSSLTVDMIPGSVVASSKLAAEYLVERGDVLFNRTSETTDEVGLASVYQDDREVIFGGFVIRGSAKDKTLLDDFKKYCFRSEWVRRQIIKGGQGVVRSNIGQGDLGKVRLLIPPIAEQEAIAHVLGLVEKAIELNNKIITQKELRRKWLMQNLLTGKKRLKGFAWEWKEYHIWDVAKEVSIRNRSDKQLTVLSCTKYAGLVPSLEYFGRKIFADDVSTYKVVPKGHFAYATNHIEEGSIGYQDSFDEALISPMYTVFKTDSSINDFFFYKLLKSHRLVYQYQARMEGSIDRRGGLRWDAFSIIKVKIPSLDEQIAISRVLHAADKEISLLKAKAERLREQKKGMMQQLLTGKKRLRMMD